MNNIENLVCDGCGQSADSRHIAARLQRLEWATRYRPVHIHTLLLSGASPIGDAEFLYAPEGEFQGEALRLLEVAGISPAGKSREAVHMEFQRAGFFLAHLLDCPWDGRTQDRTALASAIEKRAPSVVTRIRRSLKPRRVTLITELLAPLTDTFSCERLECPVVLDSGQPFALDGVNCATAVVRLREALTAAPTPAR